MTTVHFLRHARSSYNELGKMAGLHDPPLSDAGHAEARHTARFLEGTDWHASYCSPLLRARATAEAIIGARSVPLVLDPALRELDMGDFAGRTWQDVLQDFPVEQRGTTSFWKLFSANRIPNQESYEAATSRIMGFFKALPAAHPGQAVLVVAHKGVLEVFLSNTIGFDPSTDWFEIDGASVTTIRMEPSGRTKFLSVNVRPRSERT